MKVKSRKKKDIGTEATLFKSLAFSGFWREQIGLMHHKRRSARDGVVVVPSGEDALRSPAPRFARAYALLNEVTGPQFSFHFANKFATFQSNAVSSAFGSEDRMTKPRDIPFEHFIFAAIVLSVFTWFTATALLREEIRIGRPGFAKTITRADDPTEYWGSTGGFIVITAFGWFAVGMNLHRKLKQSRGETRTSH